MPYTRGDAHMHTLWTDGLNSAYEMLAASSNIGLRWVVFSEHNRKTSSYSYRDFYNEIQSLQQVFPTITLFSGAECKALDLHGNLDIHPTALKYAYPVTGVVHRFPGETDATFKSKKDNQIHSSKFVLETELNLSLALLRNPQVHILGHPLGMSVKRFGLSLSANDFIPIIESCIKYSKNWSRLFTT